MITPESFNSVFSILHVPPEQRQVADLLRAAVVQVLAEHADLRLRLDRIERACMPLLVLAQLREPARVVQTGNTDGV